MKHFTLLLLACAAMAFTLLTPPNTVVLEGILTDQYTGAPIPEANVTAQIKGQPPQTARTDDKGYFKMNLPEGQCNFVFTHEGYEGLRLLDAPTTLETNQRLAIRLEPAITQRQFTTTMWKSGLYTMYVSVPFVSPSAPPAPLPEPAPKIKIDTLDPSKLLAFKVDTASTLKGLRGKVVDIETKEELIGAMVTLTNAKDGSTQKGLTDVSGEFRFPTDLEGTYYLSIGYTAYQTQVVRLDARKGRCYSLQIALAPLPSFSLGEVVVTGYAVPLSKSTTASSVSAVRDVAKPSAPKTAKKAKKAPATAYDTPKKEAKEDVDVRPDIDELVDEAALTTTAATKPVVAPPPSTPAPAAGVLTAGEWNDLDNWNAHWSSLLKDGEIDQYLNTYQMFPKHRYTILLHNEQGFPAIDRPVSLTDASGKVYWEARTDNNGKAELWYQWTNSAAPAPTQLFASMGTAAGQRTLGKVRAYEQGINRFTVDSDCKNTPKLLDIMWAVDATGSMGDEISYLKTELLDVIQRVQRTNTNLTVRMGATFYRDQTDAYLVKTSGFSPNIEGTVNYIQQQYADGGGDTPEAVHTALEEVVLHQKWSDQAVARICFLILDASPHHRPDVVESLQNTVRAAARMGIRIVPVSASGIEKDTEFLMKALGLATNGSYVFLTDHSGVGGKHLEPTTDAYKVEAFNDLLVRLINQYASVPTCEGANLVQFEQPIAATDPSAQTTASTPISMRFFPNPATEVLTVEVPVEARKISLYNAEGVLVYGAAQVPAGQHTIPVRSLPSGYYSLRVWAEGQVKTGKVLVISDL